MATQRVSTPRRTGSSEGWCRGREADRSRPFEIARAARVEDELDPPRRANDLCPAASSRARAARPRARLPTIAPPRVSQLPPRVLIADDQPDVLEALRLLLKGEDFVVESVSSPLAKLQVLDPTLPVIVMTAWGSVEGAVEAIQLGARDYVEKPWDNARLLATLQTQ